MANRGPLGSGSGNPAKGGGSGYIPIRQHGHLPVDTLGGNPTHLHGPNTLGSITSDSAPRAKPAFPPIGPGK